MPYSVVTVQQACSTEMVNFSCNTQVLVHCLILTLLQIRAELFTYFGQTTRIGYDTCIQGNNCAGLSVRYGTIHVSFTLT